MKIRVQYTGQLRSAVGRAEDDLELPEATTLPLLLRNLAASLGEAAAPHLATAGGDVPCGLLIVRNGTALGAVEAMKTHLVCGDVIALLPPIAGG
jgi:molybdopterin converting factor small subunit